MDLDNFQVRLQVRLQYWVASLCNQLLPEFSSNQFETLHRCYKHIEDVHVHFSRQESNFFFNIFLERIMSDALEEHDGKVSIGGRNITSLRFADDIDALAEEEQELEALVESLNKTCTMYKMEISAENTKLMTNSANGIQREIKVKGQKLGTVTSFKYLGAVVSDDGSKPEVLSRIEQATAALTKLKPIWRDNNISLGSKVKLMRSLVISIFLYACESWTLTA